ncbi:MULTISPECIES: hypothetical protein [Streptomyces]|uniref:ABM domain-containing protein n=2 Tax=Streptomyces TaxID=1883 RepID=A0A646KDH1_STRJU|nr:MULTISPECIES: hypothetical protein [Streptomyces]MQS38817.1 hypothetical protein [Streptomyces katsurahamanus]MQT00168.1 hypothetical protein [Streptomyces jumonjinensis]
MTILMHATLPGVTTAQYDDLNAELQALPGDTFAGCLGHVCVAVDSGIQVFDIWQNREAMEKFFTVMAPVAEGLHFPKSAEQPTVTEVYRYWTPSS